MSSNSKHLSFKAGEVLFEEKDIADHLLIVQSGEVGVFKSGKDKLLVPITIVGANHFLGELALSQGRYRSSTAIALTRVSAITVDRKEFENQLKEGTPWLKALFKNLVERLQETNEVLRKNNFVDEGIRKRIEEYARDSEALRERLQLSKANAA